MALFPFKFVSVKGLIFIVLFACATILMFIYQTHVQHTMSILSASIVHKTVPRTLDDVLVTAPQPIPGRSIFFLETSQFLMLQLTARQACAIESAALHNPNRQIYVIYSQTTYQQQNQPLIDAIRSYANVQIRQLNIRGFAAGTPIGEWVQSGDLSKSIYLASHTSDLLRLITLYRFGGIYLDMDVVVMRSLEDLRPNFAGAESKWNVANGVMGISPYGFGHEVAKSWLLEFQEHFNGSLWSYNGPKLITRVMQKICGTNDTRVMVENRKRCQGFFVYKFNAFYAVDYYKQRYFYEPQYLEQTMALVNDSYLVHCWNRYTKTVRIKVGSNTAYEKLAEQHCPRSYGAAGEYF